MEDASNTVQILVACAMQGIRIGSINWLRLGGTKEMGSQMKVRAMYNIRFTRMNRLWLGNTKERVSQSKGVCDIWHVVHSDELFALRHESRNISNEQDVCDTWQTADLDELFAMRNYNTDGQYSYFVCDSVCTKKLLKMQTSCLRCLGVSHTMHLRLLVCDD